MSILTTLRRTPAYSNNPLAPFYVLQREFENYFGGRQTDDARPLYSPALDVREDEHNVVATLEVPGIDKNDVQISFHERILTIAGERKPDVLAKDEAVHIAERAAGKFQRSVYVPISVDASNVKAVYKDGVLTVTLPKTAEAKPKQISIAVS